MFIHYGMTDSTEKYPQNVRDHVMRTMFRQLKVDYKLQEAMVATDTFARVFPGFDFAEKANKISREFEDDDLRDFFAMLKKDQTIDVHPGYTPEESFRLLEKVYRILKQTIKNLPKPTPSGQSQAAGTSDVLMTLTQNFAYLSTREGDMRSA